MPDTAPTDIPVRASFPVARLARMLSEREAEVRRLRAELGAICEVAEAELSEWAAVSLFYVPGRLQALKTIHDLTVEALALPPAAAAPDNEACPGQLQGAAASVRPGAVS